MLSSGKEWFDEHFNHQKEKLSKKVLQKGDIEKVLSLNITIQFPSIYTRKLIFKPKNFAVSYQEQLSINTEKKKILSRCVQVIKFEHKGYQNTIYKKSALNYITQKRLKMSI